MTVSASISAIASEVANIEAGIYPSGDPHALGLSLHDLADQVSTLQPVPPPPPPPPPPSGGHIASAIAGIAPGELRAVKLEASPAVFKTPAGYDILDWTPFGAWDPSTQRVIVAGRRVVNKVLAFGDATGQWQVVALPPVLANDPNQFGHWYGEIVHGGNCIYLRGQRYVPASQQWTTPANLPSVPGDGMGASYAWFPSPGRFVRYAGDGGHRRWKAYDPATQQVTTVTGGLPCGDHAILCHHATHNKVMMIGGDYSSKKAALVTHDGTVTPIADFPGAAVSMEYKGWAVAHPAGCWLVAASGQMYAYWPAQAVWQPIGSAPGAGLQLPVIVPGYAPDIVLIVSLAGLHAWRMPTLVAP